MLCDATWQTVYQYDQNGNIISKIDYAVDDLTDHTDQVGLKEEWQYDENGNCTFYQKFISNNSINNRYIYNYTDGVLTSMYDYFWNYYSTYQWEISQIYVFTYENGNLIQKARYSRTISETSEESHTHYAYDENNRLIETWSETKNNGDWVNNEKYIYTYNENGTRNTWKIYNWDSKSLVPQYVIFSELKYEYDANDNLIKTTHYEDYNGGWNPTQYCYYTYNENNLLTSYSARSYHKTKLSWQTNDSIVYVYGNDNRLYAEINFNFDNDKECVVKLQSIDYYYYKDSQAPYYMLWALPLEQYAQYEDGYVIGAKAYLAGTTATIEAFGNEGYVFKQWSDGNTDNPRNIIMDKNYYLKAEFAHETETGLHNTTNETKTTAPAYDVLGRKVNTEYHGIVIQNGKKHIQ